MWCRVSSGGWLVLCQTLSELLVEFPNLSADTYCYSGIRRKTVLNMPLLPNLDLKNDPVHTHTHTLILMLAYKMTSSLDYSTAIMAEHTNSFARRNCVCNSV